MTRKIGQGRTARRLWLPVIVVVAVVGVAISVNWGVLPNRAEDALSRAVREGNEADILLDSAAELRIQRFCGDCHAVPQPGSFPRDAWHEGVSRGYEMYARSGRTDLDPPPFYQALAYYRSRAPREFEFPKLPELAIAPPVPFQVESISGGTTADVAAGVSHVRWARLAHDTQPELVVCDMRSGRVDAIDLRHPQRPGRLLAQLNNPCHLEVCDLDGDSILDLVVADLGSFFPDDHGLGRVVWLRGQPVERGYATTVLQTGLGRVADVQPVDVDGDGDLDLIVAEFGADRTGGIHLLRNHSAPSTPPRFEREQLDDRPGTIQVPVHDLTGDTRPDFLALISQEQERLDLFVNRGDGTFLRRLLWAAPDLTFASSGITLVDLDQDGDRDILYTNGDAFDNSYVHPGHGIQWLEQQDGMNFVYRRLADLPGAYCARAGDLDLDGDLDIVASVWLPPQIRPASLVRESLPSVVLLEQTAPGMFSCHVLEVGLPGHASLEVADFDGDGDLDWAAGWNVVTARMKDPVLQPSAVTIWWNQTTAR